ncbi:MAG: hypothetical protein HQK50_09290 [Oligoflexia bacterium]|nr:hypothetical protein [Oligoflexia bacterium]
MILPAQILKRYNAVKSIINQYPESDLIRLSKYKLVDVDYYCKFLFFEKIKKSEERVLFYNVLSNKYWRVRRKITRCDFYCAWFFFPSDFFFSKRALPIESKKKLMIDDQSLEDYELPHIRIQRLLLEREKLLSQRPQ